MKIGLEYNVNYRLRFGEILETLLKFENVEVCTFAMDTVDFNLLKQDLLTHFLGKNVKILPLFKSDELDYRLTHDLRLVIGYTFITSEVDYDNINFKELIENAYEEQVLIDFLIDEKLSPSRSEVGTVINNKFEDSKAIRPFLMRFLNYYDDAYKEKENTGLNTPAVYSHNGTVLEKVLDYQQKDKKYFKK